MSISTKIFSTTVQNCLKLELLSKNHPILKNVQKFFLILFNIIIKNSFIICSQVFLKIS